MRNQAHSNRLRFFICSLILFAGLATPLTSHAAPRPTTADTVRFLRQSTFGPTQNLIAHVQKIGFAAFLKEQFAAPTSDYPTLEFWPQPRPATCTGTCARDNYTYYQIQQHFFANALTGQDQLRQRVAFALSQILVTSGTDVNLPSWMRTYQQLLYQEAFGNFRQLLYDVTLNPAMGRFLDMVNNRCQNRTPPDVNVCRSGTSSEPNENYAREVLQLFSVGTFLLNQDGTDQVDGQGNPIFTYNQQTVTEFARVFTGWILAPDLPGPAAVGGAAPNYRDPMVVRLDSQGREVTHDRGGKTLLTGFQIPAGTSAQQDLNMALDNIAFHPNVAPFISKQLIQHLMTSNPSPAYVKRVASVFAANANSPTQLQQVVQAILIDKEARTAPTSTRNADFGKLNEPVLFMTNLLRAFNATSDGVLDTLTIEGSAIGSAAMSQDVFRAPSVFNYYAPDYEVPGQAGLYGPAFGIFSSRTSLSRANFVNRVVFANIPPAPPDRPTGTSIDLSAWTPLARNPANLVSQLSCLLLNCFMSTTMQNTVVNAVSSIPKTNPVLRVQTAIYLIATSSQYSVQR
jgi:uncharacterized protein (DUF1800 family)